MHDKIFCSRLRVLHALADYIHPGADTFADDYQVVDEDICSTNSHDDAYHHPSPFQLPVHLVCNYALPADTHTHTHTPGHNSYALRFWNSTEQNYSILLSTSSFWNSCRARVEVHSEERGRRGSDTVAEGETHILFSR
jgi:hypothetical protein